MFLNRLNIKVLGGDELDGYVRNFIMWLDIEWGVFLIYVVNILG